MNKHPLQLLLESNKEITLNVDTVLMFPYMNGFFDALYPDEDYELVIYKRVPEKVPTSHEFTFIGVLPSKDQYVVSFSDGDISAIQPKSEFF